MKSKTETEEMFFPLHVSSLHYIRRRKLTVNYIKLAIGWQEKDPKSDQISQVMSKQEGSLSSRKDNTRTDGWDQEEK